MLNWAKQSSREIVDFILNEHPISEINSIHIEPTKREYTIRIESGTVYTPYGYHLNYNEFIEKIKELCMKERAIFERLESYVAMAGPAEERNQLVEKRDSLLESLVLLCTRFCVYRYAGIISSLSPFDMLVFFATIALFDYSRPYVKFWEIMERVGY